jgi:hypothetical protein
VPLPPRYACCDLMALKSHLGNAVSKFLSGLVAVSLVIASNAQAAGCTKGAVVGGVAGHVAGKHGVAGAAGGCAIGHHEAAKKAKAASGASAG